MRSTKASTTATGSARSGSIKLPTKKVKKTVTKEYSPYWVGEHGDRAFRAFSGAVSSALLRAFHRDEGHLFTVNTEGLYDRYLASFQDPVERQFHTCSCCKSFIRHYGGLVTLTPDGQIKSAVWDYFSEMGSAHLVLAYKNVIYAMQALVESLPVTDKFLWNTTSFGTSLLGGFSHFYAHMPTTSKYPAHLTPSQAMAEKREDRKHLLVALEDMKYEHIKRAVAMLEAGGLHRPEALLPMGNFLKSTWEMIQGKGTEERNRVLWHAVSEAAPGWCTPRDSAFGALVYDIAESKTVDAITRNHNTKMDPLHYQRPQAAPKAGNIAQAEKLFEQLNLATALRRRPMAMEEAHLFWRPRPKPTATGEGLFGHITPKAGTPPLPTGALSNKTLTMTFAKFQRDILPHVLRMTFHCPATGNYSAFTTAAVADSQPLLKWDNIIQRNSGAWYCYSRGSTPDRWSIRHREVEVLGLSFLPPDWMSENYKYITGGRVLLILQGASDTNNSVVSLFPECIRSELHSVRATIEAYSKSKSLEPEHRQRASGYMLDDGSPVDITVTVANGTARYNIDRLE